MTIPCRMRVLVVEDDPTLRSFLIEALRDLGLAPNAASDGRAGLAAVEKHSFDLVLCDIKLPGPSGLEVLKAARERSPSTQVVLMTAYATVELAVEAMKAGALEFLQKPFTADVVRAVVRRCADRLDMERDIQALEHDRPPVRLVGGENGLRSVRDLVERVSRGDAGVLVFGESGVGKELVAREIHRLSHRAERRFVPLHIPAMPDAMVEAELFGHEKGSFTGAMRDRAGLVEIADGGTLFLDEIGDLAPAVQSKLLRFLQERTYRRIGSNEEQEVDVRVICATNKDLSKEVAEGRFREDLFYRLNVVPIRVPPLREHLEDLPDLVDHFIRLYAGRMRATVTSVAPGVMETFRRYRWPGNVRELENIIARALALETGTVLERAYVDEGSVAAEGPRALIARGGFSLSEHVEALEREAIRYALELEEGVKARAAARLGIKRTTLVEKMKRYGLESRADEV